MAGAEDIRLSLAGAQDKIAVHVSGENISLPLGGAPSTHILKPAIERFEGVVFNEAVCMKAASAAGLPTAGVEFRQVEGIDYLLVKRYDRQKRMILGGAEFYERLHQEDFCQALGIPSEIKYQSEGGPSLKQCFALLRDVSRVPIIDLQCLLDAVIFNVLIGNHDAHGKNFSFTYGEGTLITGKDIRLAPLYDLVSTVYYPELTPNMAMKVGDESKSEKLRPRNFEKLAIDANLAKPMVIQRVPELARTILETIDEIDISHPVGRDVITLIKERCKRFIRLFETT
jgi:serine/threonine-protein kinase HipA